MATEMRNARIPALVCPKCKKKGKVHVGTFRCTCGDGPAAMCEREGCGWEAHGLHPDVKPPENCVPGAAILLDLLDAAIVFREDGERELYIPKRPDDTLLTDKSPELQVLRCVEATDGKIPEVEARMERMFKEHAPS